MTELTETDEQFKLNPSFDAETFFKNYFGVFIGEQEPPQRIILRAYGIMVNYLHTLPLHPSQNEINKAESFSDFEYFLVPSFDFRQAILKEGHELEVIEPMPLRMKVHDELVKALKNYEQ